MNLFFEFGIYFLFGFNLDDNYIILSKYDEDKQQAKIQPISIKA